MSMIEFAKARLAEDETVAKAAIRGQADPENGWGIEERAVTPHVGVIHEREARQHIARHNPTRVQRDIAFKRRIIAAYERDSAKVEELRAKDDYEAAQPYLGAANLGLEFIAHMVTVWADHPDYGQGWEVPAE